MSVAVVFVIIILFVHAWSFFPFGNIHPKQPSLRRVRTHFSNNGNGYAYGRHIVYTSAAFAYCENVSSNRFHVFSWRVYFLRCQGCRVLLHYYTITVSVNSKPPRCYIICHKKNAHYTRACTCKMIMWSVPKHCITLYTLCRGLVRTMRQRTETTLHRVCKNEFYCVRTAPSQHYYTYFKTWHNNMSSIMNLTARGIIIIIC